MDKLTLGQTIDSVIQLPEHLAGKLGTLSHLKAERKKLESEARKLKAEQKEIEQQLIDAMGKYKIANLAGFILEIKEKVRREYFVPESKWIELKVN